MAKKEPFATVGAEFSLRDAMHKRGLCRHAVSVTFVDHVETNKHIFEILSQSGSHTILVFPYKGSGNIPTGTPPPLTGASNAGGVQAEIAILV